MAALRRMEPPTYGEWQHHEAQYGYGGYGSQTLPTQQAGGGGGGAPAAAAAPPRNKGKLIPTSRDNVPPAPPKQSQGKSGGCGGGGTPKMNGNSPAGGWWPECTCSNRDWYEQVGAVGRASFGGGRGVLGTGPDPSSRWCHAACWAEGVGGRVPLPHSLL